MRSQDYIHRFFAAYDGYEFLTFVGDDIRASNDISRRVRYYYPLIDIAWPNVFTFKAARKIQNKVLVPLQKLVGVNRLRDYPYRIEFGSNWFSITDSFAKYLLSQRTDIEKTYSCCYIAEDRVFIREGFHDREEDRQGNLRYINWWTGRPRLWTIEDKEELLRARDRGYLFSRKFDEQRDRQIIDVIVDAVRSETGKEELRTGL